MKLVNGKEIDKHFSRRWQQYNSDDRRKVGLFILNKMGMPVNEQSATQMLIKNWSNVLQWLSVWEKN